jgi:glycosyltransferase involved in cell wall biosynthesis
LKIAILVHGRFYAFDLARELLALGHDVTLFTNYPRSVVRRFGIPPARVRSFLFHGVASRMLWKLFPGGWDGKVERWCNVLFGRWLAQELVRECWDAALCFSGISEEVFRKFGKDGPIKILQRASSHIRVQRQILEAEEARSGRTIGKPSRWIIAREEREYDLADFIYVVSGFAFRSFVAQGVDPSKLFFLPLGVDTRVFRGRPEVIEARCRRILRGEPIRVLNVGAFSCRKGAQDFLEAIRGLQGEPFSFRFVGPVAADALSLQRGARELAEFVPKQPQNELPAQYEWGDVFVLPTLEDGFPVVFCQALASGLPLITTPNCSGPDLIREGVTGWVVPAADPGALASRLRWCQENRPKLAEMVREAYSSWRDLDWTETARQAEHHLLALLARK